MGGWISEWIVTVFGKKNFGIKILMNNPCWPLRFLWWKEGWMDEWMDEWMHAWSTKDADLSCQQTFSLWSWPHTRQDWVKKNQKKGGAQKVAKD